MKKMITLIVFTAILAAFLYACSGEPAANTQASATPEAGNISPYPSVINTPVGQYKDGTYEYTGKNDSEGYHVEGTMVVKSGVIQSMDWKIVDGSRGRDFDETYEEVYDVELYIQQCRDNWSGMQGYVPSLLETQNPADVDAVSGATWAYKKFEEAAKALLEQAEK